MTIGIYIRVSTQEQAKEGYSIPAQKERLMAFCAAQGWTDYRFYIDEGVSAKDTNRPELKRMIDDVKTGKIHLILVYRLDRFTRSVRDLYNMLETLEKYKCAFKSATELYDTSSAMGRMFIGLVALLAQWETENLSERVKMALEEKVSGGERVGNVPYGFDLSDEEKLIKNEKSIVVLDMIDKLKSGMSVNAIADYLNKVNDDRTWHPTAVFRILQNPALYGATRWNDKVFENTHEGERIISKTEFFKLQRILEDRSIFRRRDVASTYIFQGVLSCPQCGSTLSVNRYVRKRKDGTEYQGALYKCQVCWKNGDLMISIGEQRILDALEDFMKNFNIDKKYFNFNEINKNDDERKVLTKQLKQIEKMRERYQKGWAMGKIKDEEFDRRMDETEESYEELKGKLSQIKDPVQIDINAINEIVTIFNKTFFCLTQEEKRMFVSQFIRKITFDVIPQPPKDKKNKKGKGLVEIRDIDFY